MRAFARRHGADQRQTKCAIRKFANYRGGDYVGREGLEAHYESDLRGVDGGEYVTIDARGRTLRSLGEDKPQAGHSLKLALDMGLQRAAYDLLKAQFDGKNKRYPGSHTGAVVALNPANGEVLALVSMPSYDLNNYGENYDALNGDKTKPLFNRATSAALACGSPFKLITAAAGLEAGKASRYTTYFCPGYKRIGNRIFHCDEVHRYTAFEKAIGASCNVYFYTVAEDVGPDALAEMAKRFGLGKTTGIDLPSGVGGRVPSPAWKRKVASDPANKIWYPGDTANMAIGQGDLLVTPIQLANYTAGPCQWRYAMASASGARNSGYVRAEANGCANHCARSAGQAGPEAGEPELDCGGNEKNHGEGRNRLRVRHSRFGNRGQNRHGRDQAAAQLHVRVLCRPARRKAAHRACRFGGGWRLRFRNRRAHRPRSARAIFSYPNQPH